MIRAFSAALLAFACVSAITAAPAHARKNHHQSVVTSYDNDGHMRGAAQAVDRSAYRSARAAARAERAALRAERRSRAYTATQQVAPMFPQAGGMMSQQAPMQAQAPVDRRARGMVHAGRGQILGGRPAGCPSRYCGCATAIKIFGRHRPELNLAANWVRKFPRTAPAPGMAAARSGHVMVLMEHVGGDQWKVWDANSGGGLTRIHVRSIRGFAVVNPHATSVAQSTATTSAVAAD
jgi:hypothetical protein